MVAREREHDEVLDLMMEAEETQTTIQGVKGVNPMACLPQFDVVWSFSLDFMHSCCLGNMKNLLKFWIEDKTGKFVQPSISFEKQFNSELSKIQGTKEISRNPQDWDVHYYKLWKANQFKNLLFVFGPIILKNILKKEVYKNFLCLSQALFIFNVESISETDFDKGTNLIFQFINSFEIIYGEASMKYNIHTMIHIPMCVLNLGPLFFYSLFAYESKNNFVNKYVSGSYNVVQEATNKISLYQNNFLGTKLRMKENFKTFNNFSNILISKKTFAPKLDHQTYEIVKNRGMNFLQIKKILINGILYESSTEEKKNKMCNSFILTTSGEIGFINMILIDNNNVFVILKEGYGIVNRNVQILYVRKYSNPQLKCVPISSISKKLIFFEKDLIFTFMPNQYECD